MKKRLYKSETDRAICGVCGGIAEYFDIDSIVVRLVAVILALAFGSGILVYIIAAIIIPNRPKQGYTPYQGQRTAYVSPDGTVYENVSTQDGTGYSEDSYSGNYDTYQEKPDYTEGSYDASDAQNRTTQKRSVSFVGLMLILIGAATILKVLIPVIDSRIIWAVLAILAGIILLIKKR